MYLGTDLSPEEFYRSMTPLYCNPHAVGVRMVLEHMSILLKGRVLDLGCGDGLVTKILAPQGHRCIGVDAEQAMVDRYQQETGMPARQGFFWDPLPQAQSAVASYSLHLCPTSRHHEVWNRLVEAGVMTVVVISPFRNNPDSPTMFYKEASSVSLPFGPKQKSVHGRAFVRD